MYPVPTAWRKALGGPHFAKSRVEMFDGPTSLGDVNITSGAVVDTWPNTAGVRRQLTLSTPDRTIRTGLTLKVWHGMQFGTGPWEWIPGGVFPVLESSVNENFDSTVSVVCSDRWQWVIGARFGGPYQMPRGVGAAELAAKLIAESGPWGPVTQSLPTTAKSAGDVFDESRHDAIVALMSAAGGQAWADRTGTALISARSTNPPSVVRLAGGDGGTLTGLSATDSLDDVVNMVAARSSSSDDGVAAAVGVQWARITDPNSPIHASRIGARVRRYASPVLTTPAQALKAAGTILGWASAASRTLAVGCVPDSSLDAGDCITVVHPATGIEETAMIQRVAHPLAGGVQTIDTVDTRTDYVE